MIITIFQIDRALDANNVCFLGSTARRMMGFSNEIDFSIYRTVFSGNVSCNDLDEVFYFFNFRAPSFKMRSLSVSDIIFVQHSDSFPVGFYFVHEIGFRPLYLSFGKEHTHDLSE